MRILAFLCIFGLVLSGCGKKSEPKYEGKIKQIKIII